MTPRFLLILSAASIVAYDAIAALASLVMSFPYAIATVGSIALYVVIGAAAARLVNRKFSLIAGAVAGITDATAGWWVSWLIGPGRLPSDSINLTKWLATAAVVTVIACIAAGISGIIATWKRPTIRA